MTVYRSHRVRGGAVSVNRAFLRGLLLERTQAVVLDHQRAQQRRLVRRTALYRDVLETLKDRDRDRAAARALQCGARARNRRRGGDARNESRPNTRSGPKATLQGVGDRLLPDVYLAFDARTHATLTASLQGRQKRSIAMPHPWHVEVHREHLPLRPDTAELDALLRRFRAAFLVTMQWGYDGESAPLSTVIPNGIMHQALREAITTSPKDVLWLLRLHPIQLKRRKYAAHREYAAELARSCANVETTLATALPLPVLLPRAHGHITMISGSAGEAALFGIPSLLLCPSLKPGGAHAGLFSELIEAGAATLGELDARAILTWIAERTEQPPQILRKDWQREAAELERRLDELLKAPR